MSGDDDSTTVCPRCAGGIIRPLGDASSTLQWFTCQNCQHVWAAGASAPSIEAALITARPVDDPRKHILVVDDDVATLSVLARMLADYRVSEARSADEALAILATHEPVDLLITDYVMPGITGEELVGQARELRPHLRVLFVTGHASAIEKGSALFASEVHLAKPVALALLLKTVKSMIGPALTPPQ